MRKLGLATLLCFGLFFAVAVSAYGDTVVYTGDSDTAQFPPTMDGGAAITYTADTIDFSTIDHAGTYEAPTDSVDLPADSRMGRGDFEYTMDLAMTDLDDMPGWYEQAISVAFGPEGTPNNQANIYWGATTEEVAKYVGANAFGGDPSYGDITAGAGAGAISLRIKLVGNALTLSYKPAIGDNAGTWDELLSVDMSTTDLAGMDWSLGVWNWGFKGGAGGYVPTVHKVDEISVVYTPTTVLTGTGDDVLFPATMDGGAAITYTADTIDFATIDHAGTYEAPTDSVDLPEGIGIGLSDFEYTMDLAMTDLDDMPGWYEQAISVAFGPEGTPNNQANIYWGATTEEVAKYVGANAFGGDPSYGDITAGAGAGAISLRIKLVGNALTLSYKPAIGDNAGTWDELLSVDITTTDVAGMAWSLGVWNWGFKGGAGGYVPTVHKVDEIRVTQMPLSMIGTAPVITITGGAETDFQLKLVNDPVYLDAGATALDAEDGDITGSIITTGDDAVDRSVAGEYEVTYEVTDLDGNTTTVTRTVTVGPVGFVPSLSLEGEAEEDLNYDADPPEGWEYDDPGATAFDTEDGLITDITVDSSAVDPSTLGVYEVTYTIEDSDGNPVQSIRTVTVADLTGPVVTPTGGPYIEVDQGGTYTEAEATATDNLDDDATVTAAIVIGGDTVDTTTVGTYQVTYTVSDAAGNETVGTRTVSVLDITPPVLTLTVDETISISQWSDFDYADIAATATDGIDGDITDNIVVTGSVKTNVPGDYILTYTITDAAGNETAVTRTVTVGPDVTPPVITLIWPADYVEGSSTVVVPQGGLYIDEGATALDDVDGDVTREDEETGVVGIVVDSSAVDMSTEGEYVVTITASDRLGNEAVVTRTVIVEPDTDPPVITVTYSNLATLEIDPTLAVGDLYRDMGATAFDSADLDLSLSIVITSWYAADADGTPVETIAVFDNDDAVDTSTVGTYVMGYNVIDAAGNVAEEQTRTVTVVDAQISGTVEDTAGNALEGAVVELYLPVNTYYNLLDPENRDDVLTESTDDFFAWRYKKLTAADGTYAFVLPSDAPLAGWTVVASMDGYASKKSANKNPDVDTLANFTGGNALAPKTELVSVTATVGASKTGLEITGYPPFTDAGQVTVKVESGDGDVDNDSNSLSDDGSIQATYGGVDDFTVRITTDTSELLFPYVAEDADLLVKLGEIGAGGGTVDMATEAGQPVKVEVPTGGVAGFAAFTIEIKQIPIEAVTETNEGSLNYVYEITALSPQRILDEDGNIIADVGEPMPDTNIKRMEITLPIDLSVVNQNDMEDGIYVIYRADSRLSLDQPGEATPVPVGQILDTDYTGDGLLGSVTFWTDELSVFGIGSHRTALMDQSEDRSQGGCFVHTIAHGQSPEGNTGFPVALIAGLVLIAVFLSRLRGRSGKAIAGLAVLVACVFLIGDPADAEDGGFYIELKGMLAFENIDVDQTEAKFTGPLAVNFDDSPGFQFAIGRTYSDYLSLKAVFEYVVSFDDQTERDFQAWDKLDVLHGSLNAKLSYPGWKKVKPYLVAGLGIMRAHENILYHAGSASEGHSETRDLGISVRGGAGVDVFVTDSVSIGIEGAYTIADVEYVKYATVSVGLAYHF